MKKGDAGLTFVFSLIFLAIILAFFFAIFSINAITSSENKVISLVSASDNINLLNYLRTPTKINNFSIADLIVYSYYNDDFDDLEELTNDIFNKVYQEDKCPVWILNSKINDDEFFEADSDFNINELRPGGRYRDVLEPFGISGLRYTSSQILIPGLNQDKFKVSLIIGCIK